MNVVVELYLRLLPFAPSTCTRGDCSDHNNAAAIKVMVVSDWQNPTPRHQSVRSHAPLSEPFNITCTVEFSRVDGLTLLLDSAAELLRGLETDD